MSRPASVYGDRGGPWWVTNAPHKGHSMADDEDEATGPLPLSGYFDIALTFLLPFLGVGLLLFAVFWVAVRPTVSDIGLRQWFVGIAAVSALAGVVNAVRYTRKTYRR